MSTKLEMMESLDPSILHDHLMKILMRSPQTMSYASNRVAQIIAEVMSIPVIKELNAKVEQLETITEELQQTVEMDELRYSKKEEEYGKCLKQCRENKETLSRQAEAFRVTEMEKQKCQQTIRQLQKYHTKAELELEELRGKYSNSLQSQSQQNDLITQLKNEIENLRQQCNAKTKEIKELGAAYHKLKKANKQTKYNEIKYRKQWEASQKCEQSISIELAKVREEAQHQKLSRNNQRKAMYDKLTHLYSRSQHVKKVHKQLTFLSIANEKLRKQLHCLKQQFLNGIKMLQQQFRKVSNALMDEIGGLVNKQIKQLMTQMNRNGVVIKIMRDEMRIKDEILQKLEKASQVQLMGNRELQKELRSKKMEVNSLRKELKRNFEETQLKYMGIERNCKEILAAFPACDQQCK